MGQWSDLPRELLEKIEEHLVLYVDNVRIRAICEWWNACLEKIPTNHHPWLLQPLEDDPDASYALLDVDDAICYKLDLPEAEGKVFKGCSHGWLVTMEDVAVDPDSLTITDPDESSTITSPPEDSVEEDNTDNDDTEASNYYNPAAMYLLNPLTKERIKLPPRYTFPGVYSFDVSRVGWEYAFLDADKLLIDTEGKSNLRFASLSDTNFILTGKVVLSSTPSEEDCCVVAIFSVGKLAWCKCNDNEWKFLPTGQEKCIHDIIFYKGKLHALNIKGELTVFENLSSIPEVMVVGGLPNGGRDYNNFSYLVESSDGELVMVRRYVNDVVQGDSLFCTYGIKVWKLDHINSMWIQVESIGEDILFLGMNASFSVSSQDLPGWKGNCIHFTDTVNVYESRGILFNPPDIGIYDLDEKSLKPLPGFEYDPDEFVWPPPIWLSRPSPKN